MKRITKFFSINYLQIFLLYNGMMAPLLIAAEGQETDVAAALNDQLKSVNDSSCSASVIAKSYLLPAIIFGGILFVVLCWQLKKRHK